jgi:hypothetical protein
VISEGHVDFIPERSSLAYDGFFFISSLIDQLFRITTTKCQERYRLRVATHGYFSVRQYRRSVVDHLLRRCREGHERMRKDAKAAPRSPRASSAVITLRIQVKISPQCSSSTWIYVAIFGRHCTQSDGQQERSLPRARSESRPRQSAGQPKTHPLVTESEITLVIATTDVQCWPCCSEYIIHARTCHDKYRTTSEVRRDVPFDQSETQQNSVIRSLAECNTSSPPPDSMFPTLPGLAIVSLKAAANDTYRSRPDLSPPRLNVTIPCDDRYEESYLFVAPFVGYADP